jgi:hypothetical protein
MAIRETLKEAGYKHFTTLKSGQHVLYNLGSKSYELWFANKNHASYGLTYGNTHLEFARTLKDDDAVWHEVKIS